MKLVTIAYISLVFAVVFSVAQFDDDHDDDDDEKKMTKFKEFKVGCPLKYTK